MNALAQYLARAAARPQVRFSSRPAVLFVCTANICRSPMAEGVLRRLLARAGVDADIDSAATHDYCLGLPPYPVAMAAAKQRGYDITQVTARRVRPHDFRFFDLIVAMDRGHRRWLEAKAPARHARKIQLMLEFSGRYSGQDVPDPYGGSAAAFEHVLDRIEDGCRGLARLIVANTYQRTGTARTVITSPIEAWRHPGPASQF